MTDRSKDIPGKNGYSVHDREKLLDVVCNPQKYGVDPSGKKGGCRDFFLLMLFVIFMAVKILIGV